jgi:hypothetical protein
MIIKHSVKIILVLFIFWGCQQNSDKQQHDTKSESLPTQGQAPGDNTANPDLFHPLQTAGEVSDKELRQFLSAAMHVQVISQQSQQDMVTAVEQGGMKAERFSEIQQAEMDPAIKIDLSIGEKKQFETASREIEKIQDLAMQKIVERITAAGLSENRYQEIISAVQNTPALQEKLQAIQEQLD